MSAGGTGDASVGETDLAELAQSLLAAAAALLATRNPAQRDGDRSSARQAESEVEDDAPLTLTVEEAARLLGISRAHCYELVARDELPSIRLGRRIVIPRKALVSLAHGARK